MFTLAVETVLFTLFGDPFPKGAVTRVVLRDNAVSVLVQIESEANWKNCSEFR